MFRCERILSQWRTHNMSCCVSPTLAEVLWAVGWQSRWYHLTIHHLACHTHNIAKYYNNDRAMIRNAYVFKCFVTIIIKFFNDSCQMQLAWHKVNIKLRKFMINAEKNGMCIKLKLQWMTIFVKCSNWEMTMFKPVVLSIRDLVCCLLLREQIISGCRLLVYDIWLLLCSTLSYSVLLDVKIF